MVLTGRMDGGSLPGLGFPPPSRSGLLLCPTVTSMSGKLRAHMRTLSVGLSGAVPVLRKVCSHGMDSVSDCAMAWLSPHAHLDRSEVRTLGSRGCLCVHIHPFSRFRRGMFLVRRVVGLLVFIPS